MARSRTHPLAAAHLLIVVLICSATAQLSQLDQDTLIDGLAQQGMTELLMYLAEAELADDPILAAQIQIAQHQIQYADTRRSSADRFTSLEKAISTLRALTEQYRDHEQRPLWQTDLAELLLLESLQTRYKNTAEFYEFGVPTAQQRTAFEAVVTDVYAQLTDADIRFAQLQTQLPREPDHVQKRIDTGLWDRMMNKYYNLRTQFLLAHAAYFVALLDDTSHPYYQRLGDHAVIRDQAQNPQAERLRLLELASERIEVLLRRSNLPATVARQSASLAGRARAAQKDFDTAQSHFDQVLADAKNDLTDLTARLGRAIALAHAADITGAFDGLDHLQDHELVRANLLMRLLVLDVRHRIELEIAQSSRDPAAIAEAYGLYLTLLEDPAAASAADALRSYIYRRWESSISDGPDLSQLPPLVVLAIGQVARTEGQRLIHEAAQARQRGEETRAADLRAGALQKLDRATAALEDLLQRDDLDRPTKAGAAFNLGMATYLRGESESSLLEAVQIWTELAAQMPDQRDAERAISTATTLLRQWQPQQSEAIEQAYQRTTSMLFAKYPSSEAADDERYAHAAFNLIPAGRLEQAVDQFAAVPFGHREYYLAQKELLYALLAIYRSAPTERDKHAERIVKEATRLSGEAERALAQHALVDAAVIRSVLGHCFLVLADLDLAQNKPQRALQRLQTLPEALEQDAEVTRTVLAKRIVAHAAAGEPQIAVEQAQEMIQRFPDAAAQVVDHLLSDLDRQANDLRHRAATVLVAQQKQTLEQQAQATAKTASELARVLLQSASQQGYSSEQLLDFELIFVRSLRLGGEIEEARQRIEPLLKEFGTDAQTIHEAGETFFALSSEEDLAKAVSYFDRIIIGFQTKPYPEIWWNAWMRRFQIMDQLNLQTEDIPVRFRRLRQISPGVGGERFKREMQRLANKHAP